MGTGRLKRIAALSTLATVAVMIAGAISAPAQISVPTVDTTGTSVTVPSTTVRVPSTTVTTPSVTVKPPAPKVTAPPKVKAPAPKTVVKAPVDTVKQTVPKVTSPITKAPSSGGGSGSTIKKVTSAPKQITQLPSNVTGGGAGGGGTSGSGTVGTLVGGLGQTAGPAGTVRVIGGSTGSGAGGGLFVGGTTSPGGGGITPFFGGPGGGGPGASGGGFGGGTFFGSGPGAGVGPGGGGGSLAAMLAGATSLQLLAVLEDLQGCIPSLPSLDRRVLSMRSGLGGGPALSRSQVATRLGMSKGAVRTTERRALNRLQFAAVNTGCAGAVVGPFDAAGIGDLTAQLVMAGAVPVAVKDAVVGDFSAARGAEAQVGEPLFDLNGGGDGGPAWAIILFTVLLSVSIAALTRELRSSF